MLHVPMSRLTMTQADSASGGFRGRQLPTPLRRPHGSRELHRKIAYNRGLISSRRHSVAKCDPQIFTQNYCLTCSHALPPVRYVPGPANLSAHHEPILNRATCRQTCHDEAARAAAFRGRINKSSCCWQAHRDEISSCCRGDVPSGCTLSIDEPTRRRMSHVQLALRHADTYEWLYRSSSGSTHLNIGRLA